MTMKNATGRGSNLTDADRKKGGEHSHQGRSASGSQKSGAHSTQGRSTQTKK